MELNACEVPPNQARKKLRDPRKWKRTIQKTGRYIYVLFFKLCCLLFCNAIFHFQYIQNFIVLFADTHQNNNQS